MVRERGKINVVPDQTPRSTVPLDVAVGDSPPATRAEPDAPFRILVLGDFSGRKNRGVASRLQGRRPVAVDRDNLDEVMAAMGASLRLGGTRVRFAELDDFHPDALYSRLPVFQNSPADDRTAIHTPPPVQSGADLLDSILAEAQEPLRNAPLSGDVAEVIRRAMQGQLATRDDPRDLERRQRVDAFRSDLMRALLHDPDFQALEAAWRGVDMLARGLDTDGALKLHVFDTTLAELIADAGGLETLLVRPTEPWAVIAANFVFGRSAEDVGRLRRCANLAQAGGAPFIAESEPPSGDAAPAWQALRKSPEAQWVGLALPRFLLRLPYGKNTSPIEHFEFEEMPKSNHPEYLWGNPAFCCAFLLGQSFLDHGWKMRPGTHKQISPLPQHVYEKNGEWVMKPCAETWMTDSLAETLMNEGIMPLASLKDQDAALLVRFQSIAEPLTPLSGRW